jgi:SM-20-related protein
MPVTTELVPGLDLLLIRDFIDPATCEGILQEMLSAPANAATVYLKDSTGEVEARMRRVSRVLMRPETVALIRRSLLDNRQVIGKHFDLVIEDCEEPQFLRYRTGDFFVAHQDGNTGLIKSSQEEFRKISVSIFLNDQSESARPGTYGGGSLVFHPRHASSYHLHAERGNLAAFRAETTHEVIPVTHGERFAIACWYG